MKKILIIEDEHIAAQHLQRTLADVLPDADVLPVLQSIEETVEYFSSPLATPPDLVFMDIHLADGLAFRIFDSVQIDAPIIFTTAYDQYALDAFRVNSIDYLLKPISTDGLRRALQKLERMQYKQPEPEKLASLQTALSSHYRSHFLIPVRDKLIPIDVQQIACLYLEDKITRAILFDGRQQIFDHPLDVLMEQLDPALFFRANRQYIVAHRAITEISLWPISKLALTLCVDTPDRIIISKARTSEFKKWYTK